MSLRVSRYSPRTSLSILVLTFCGCANGLGDSVDLLPSEPDKPAPSVVLGQASGPDSNSDVDGGAEGQGDRTGAQDGGSYDAGGNGDQGGHSDASLDVATQADSGAVASPLLDGTIQPGEYGVHTDGQNQQASVPNDPNSTTWYMTWSDTHLYVAVLAANVAEGVVLYVDHAPLNPSTSGTNADGSLVSVLYDNTKAGKLPFRADFVAYVKASYNEYRTANGANGWSAQVSGALQVKAIGSIREIAIPWTAIRAGGRPSSFAWLGYATSSAGYVYGAMPVSNPRGNIGQNATFGFFFKVADTTPGTGTKPFAFSLNP